MPLTLKKSSYWRMRRRRAGWSGFAFGAKAPDSDFGFVYCERANDADPGGKLVHQIDVGIETKIARFIDHLVGAQLAKLACKGLMWAKTGRTSGLSARPQQHMAVFENRNLRRDFRPAVGIDGMRPFGFVVVARDIVEA